jgi:hypothetical protein
MTVAGFVGFIGLVGLSACGGDDSSATTTAAASSTTPTAATSTTMATTATAAPTTVPATTTTAPDPALAPPCNVGEVKVNRESKQYFEPGDPRYGTVPPPLVICLPSSAVAQSEGFQPAPPA